MYKISVREFGFHLQFKGFFDAGMMAAYFDELRKIVLNSGKFRYGNVVDLRFLFPMDEATMKIVGDIQRFNREHGQARSAVILQHPVTARQLIKSSRETGIFEWERFIDARQHESWEKHALKWIIEGVEPLVDFENLALSFNSDSLWE